MTKILGIETTCDETSASVVENKRVVLSNILASQAKLHSKYGGVVPELASRKHLEALPAIVEEALNKAKVTIKDIDAIAVSKEPGLPPALQVGYAYASGLATSKNLPLIEVNHLEGHISGIWLIHKGQTKKRIPYPYLCLLVSGGHTEIRLISSEKNQKILGRTLDDASGEAFDKVARILGLEYPGGPIIDRLSKEGDEHFITFPRPMADSDNFNFSFSGLKTSVMRKVDSLKKDHSQYKHDKKLHKELTSNWVCDIAASFQEAVVDVLVAKTIEAAHKIGVPTITIAGGVSANSRLRDIMGRACHEHGFELFYPELEFCIDNAAMIAARGSELFHKKK